MDAAMMTLAHITLMITIQIFNCIHNEFTNIRIFVMNLRIFEYIRTLTCYWSEYSNIFVSWFLDIRIRILDIRQKIFEYSNIFEYSLRSDFINPFITLVQKCSVCR